MVNSVSKIIQHLIDNDLSLQDALQRDYANYSAIARMLKPKVEKSLRRKVKLESLITSVKRAKASYSSREENITKIIAESVIHLRTDVVKVSVEKTKRNLEIVRKVLTNFPGEFLQVLEGVSAITLIFDQKLFDNVYSIFRKEDILDERQNLAAIVVQSPREIIDTPGCAIAFYNPVSRSHINIEETMSCFTDTILVLRMEDVGKAFTALTDLIAEARKTVGK
ncbi:hypothetical protein DRO69_13660 [Candidatus Bathyarchaeota archaeon]|nr:MAG: hypothetical protein DRO69_13660 [Candidatus Bathyarchaeota archaeon]